jgi:t-SNARE complex subunit (syntaxin)
VQSERWGLTYWFKRSAREKTAVTRELIIIIIIIIIVKTVFVVLDGN